MSSPATTPYASLSEESHHDVTIIRQGESSPLIYRHNFDANAASLTPHTALDHPSNNHNDNDHNDNYNNNNHKNDDELSISSASSSSVSSRHPLIYGGKEGNEENDDPDALRSHDKIATPSHEKLTQGLERRLGFIDGVSIIIGIMIGTGIFASPAAVLTNVGSNGIATIFIWVMGGVLSLVGGLCYAELGAMFPLSGGPLVYLQNTWNTKLIPFVFVWAHFMVLKSGSQAILAIILARYLTAIIFDYNLHEGDDIDGSWFVKFAAITAIIVVTAFNIIGVTFGSLIQKIFVVLKFIAITLIIIFAIVFVARNGTKQFTENFSGGFRGIDYLRSGLSLIAAMWAYDGWVELNNVAEEVKRPERNLLLAVFVGCLTVTAIYTGTNLAYFAVFSLQEIADTPVIAIDLSDKVIGKAAGIILSLLVAASAFGTLNGSILTGSRVIYAAGRDNMFPFPRIFATLGRTKTPYPALLLQMAWAIVVVLPGNFESLLSYFGFSSWFFYGLAGVCVIVLRIRRPDIHRPFKIPFFACGSWNFCHHFCFDGNISACNITVRDLNRLRLYSSWNSYLLPILLAWKLASHLVWETHPPIVNARQFCWR